MDFVCPANSYNTLSMTFCCILGRRSSERVLRNRMARLSNHPSKPFIVEDSEDEGIHHDMIEDPVYQNPVVQEGEGDESDGHRSENNSDVNEENQNDDHQSEHGSDDDVDVDPASEGSYSDWLMLFTY